MNSHLIDVYADTGSVLHTADPRAKVSAVLLLIVIVGLTPMGAFGAYVGFFALAMAGALVGRLDPLLIVRRSLIALPFALAAILLIFTVPGPPVLTLPLTGWAITAPGLVRFASILFKSMISVQFAALLLATTHFTAMLWALGALRVPRVLVAIISFMYRYIFVLAEEAGRLARARDSRSAVLPGVRPRSRSLVFRARTTGRLIGALFLRSFARSERVYMAMVSRGYRGEVRLLNPQPLTARDALIAGLPVALGGLLLAASLLLG
ncbi:MAG: cobalt ECF transporter T component CbiQ [Aggregatilineales bacterium]|nr:cobalt ECF transporter T component CbiQ [Chloroflexota bacterium]HOA24504.1 cobalt ECF transporter T component CbiQ [Aggregatilineales bacterium]HPV06689.1 cobalt ECF transporter T component CbiQ [Aggregatilineales bacterium]